MPGRAMLALACLAMLAPPHADAQQAGLLRSEFVYQVAPFPSAHASTIVESHGMLLSAWFGGQYEGAPDVGIWLSRLDKSQWSAPVQVADGTQPDGRRFPCWNPVLFQPRTGPLTLFYKVGPNPREWWGMVRTSADGGRTWSPPQRLPDGILGPSKNKPIELSDGVILLPSSTESTDNPPKWRVHFERSVDHGAHWSIVTPPPEPSGMNLIQPSVLLHAHGMLQAIGRSQSGRIFESWSSDEGLSWSAPSLTTLPNPNAGIDAVTLRDGRQLVVYNHATEGRSPLNVAVSRDGKNWLAALVLEDGPGEYSYPAVIQTHDGLVHVTYTWKRQRIRHVVLDPRRLKLVPIVNGRWPQ